MPDPAPVTIANFPSRVKIGRIRFTDHNNTSFLIFIFCLIIFFAVHIIAKIGQKRRRCGQKYPVIWHIAVRDLDRDD